MGASSAQRDRFIDSCPSGRLLASLHSLAANLLLERLPPFGALWPGSGRDRPVRIAGGQGEIAMGSGEESAHHARVLGSGKGRARPRCGPLPSPAAQAWEVAFHAFPSHGDQHIPPLRDPRSGTAPVYPDGIKAHGHERHTMPVGRRGKPVKKVRYMPMARAHALARKLQGRPGTTVSGL